MTRVMLMARHAQAGLQVLRERPMSQDERDLLDLLDGLFEAIAVREAEIETLRALLFQRTGPPQGTC